LEPTLKQTGLFIIALFGIGCATAPKATQAKQHSHHHHHEVGAHGDFDLVAFGSCSHQDDPMPVWKVISSHKPDVFLFIGDNVYGDVTGQDPDMPELKAAYEKLGRRGEFHRFQHHVPILPIWDDHDYGMNDAGGAFSLHAESKAIFARFWNLRDDDPRLQRRGIYHAEVQGPPDKQVQIILLDTRSFRSEPEPTDQLNAVGKERYVPSSDTTKTVLGEAQWTWLEGELRKPADLRLIVSSFQILAEDHGWESWNLFPHERTRLFDLIKSTNARDVVLLSGDRHVGALYRSEAGPYPIYELTSSSLNRPIAGKVPYDPGAPQIGPVFVHENFGLIRVDWASGMVSLELRDLNNDLVIDQKIELSKEP
jgi:alkaline phosphatase D